MDYANVSGSPDLHGQSPWGSSSPRASRSSFGPPEDPPSPSTPTRDPAKSQPQADSPSPSQAPPTGHERAEHDQIPPQQPDFHNGQQSQSQQVQQSQKAQQSQQRPGAARYQAARQHRPPPQYKLQAKITALERTGRKDPVLRFDVHTNLPKFRTTQFRDVRRTHSEFEKLAEHLISSNPEALVPAVPPALTSAGAGTDEDETRVKNSLQRWLNYVCGNDVLMRDEEMVFFVESDFGYSPVVRMKQPATGVRRKMLKQFAPPPDDTPELHEARPVVKLFYLGALDAGQKMDKVVKARRALGLAESSLGEKLSQMYVQETHPGLSHAYRKLGRIIQTTGDYHAAQGTAEATTLGDPLTYHSGDAFVVKETLTNRHILLRELQQASASRMSKEFSVQRLKSSTSVKREKVDEAISALDEALSQENYLKGKTSRVTANLLLEKRRWFDRTTSDLNSSIREYTLRQIEAERRTLAMLESVRSDIRAIDASGGLSRLGRENHPVAAARRISLASSQGVKGDAWSGVARSREGLNRSISGGFGPGGPGVLSEVVEAAVGMNGGGADKDGRPRSATNSSTLGSVKEGTGKDEDEDRVDARNAASRLAQSTF